MSEHNTTAVQLEGWLPGEENNGLPAAGEQLMEAFEDAYRTGEDTTGATLTLTVSLIEVTKASYRKDPKAPIVAVRTVRTEVIRPGNDYQTVRDILDGLHDARVGKAALPGLGDDDLDADPGEGPEIIAAAAEREKASKK